MEDLQDLELVKSKIISIEELFKDNKVIELDQRRLLLFLNGVNLEFKLQDGIYRIYDEDNRFIGTGVIKGQRLKRDVIL